LSLSIFLIILEKSGNKKDEICLLFLNNKILTRLNIIILEIFSDETNLENENTGTNIEKIMDIIIKFTEVNNLIN
jgi:hypothetical protein